MNRRPQDSKYVQHTAQRIHNSIFLLLPSGRFIQICIIQIGVYNFTHFEVWIHTYEFVHLLYKLTLSTFPFRGKTHCALNLRHIGHVVTWETKRETTTKTKHSINTLRVVPSLHSKWAFTLVRLSYAESKNCEFYDSQKFWCRPKPPGVAGGWKKLPVGDGFAIARRLLLQTKATTKEWQHVSHCCRISKFGTPILRLREEQ